MSGIEAGFDRAAMPSVPASRPPRAPLPKPPSPTRDTPSAGIASGDTQIGRAVAPSSPTKWKAIAPPPFAPALAIDESSAGPPASTWRHTLEHRVGPPLVSLVIHCLIVLILGLMTFASRDSNGTLLTGVFSEDAAEGLDSTVITPFEETEPPASAGAESLADGGGSIDGAVAALDLPVSLGGASSGGGDALLASILGSGDGEGGGMADLEGLGSKSANFYGLSAKGNRFVFVIDSSTSMWGPRWIDVRKELVRSIRKLHEDQYFFVICFDVGAISMFGPESEQQDFAAANEENFRKLEYWLSQHTLGPGTKATLALNQALKLKPDAIFLLTDGEFQDNVLNTLRTNNRNRNKKRKVTVNTIGFHSQLGAPVLGQIATENYGQFRYVPPTEEALSIPPMRFPRGGRVTPPRSIEEIQRSLTPQL